MGESRTKVSRRLIGITGMRDIVERRIPVLTLDSGVPGPVVWLTACLHGDEAGGTVIVHEVFAAVQQAGLECGCLNALPLINSMGFENISRYINTDREDLNRCFPGNAKGSIGERIAKRIFDNITQTKPALVIDLHNDWIHSVPYILVEPDECFTSDLQHRKTAQLAKAAGLLRVRDNNIETLTQGTLTDALISAGIPAFTVEAGGAGRIVEECVDAGTAAVMTVLKHLRMLEPRTVIATQVADSDLLLNYTNQPLCTTSGLVRFLVQPGDQVEANQPVARVFSAFGSCEETLRASASGYVLGIADHARAVPGCEVIAIGELATA